MPLPRRPALVCAFAAVAAAAPTPPELPESFERLASLPSRDYLHRRLLAEGVVLMHLAEPPANVSKGVMRRFDAYLRPRYARDKGSGAEADWPTDGVPLAPTDGSYVYGASHERRDFPGRHVLAKADDTVQGPHQEQDMSYRVICLFYCEVPAERDGGTALFDMQRAWALLPLALQTRLRNSYWQLPGLDKIPCAVKHPRTGKPILLFYCFGRLARDCVDVYRERTGRYHVREDPYTYGVREGDPLIADASGAARPFIGTELYKTLDCIYDSMVAHTWLEGDAMLVDNIRWAHARLDGSGGRRKIHFAWWGYANAAFSPRQLPRPGLEDLSAETV